MIDTKRKGNTGKSKPTVWGELNTVCRKVHTRLYGKRDMVAAKRFQLRLKQLLSQLPENESVILKAEAEALLSELQQVRARAIKYRKQEIQLIQQLHESVARSVADWDYGARMARSILKGRDLSALEERRKILLNLKGRVDSRAG